MTCGFFCIGSTGSSIDAGGASGAAAGVAAGVAAGTAFGGVAGAAAGGVAPCAKALPAIMTERTRLASV
ncbi:MAG: hypothetical protein DWI10_03550 [Planctomycetota bacterium]|nr:MAG: hypothetical protein DWI10_03550 [Planctomycetota bacterium]